MKEIQRLSPPRNRHIRTLEHGQSLVEFAFIVPMLFIMLIGVAVIAQGFNLQMVLYGAAYEGARIWAKNPAGGDNIHCTPPACNPNSGEARNFEKYVKPAVRQYVTNNGFDGNQVFFYAEDPQRSQKQLDLEANNPQTVRVTLLYPYRLPIGVFIESFERVLISATCTLKRGS
ncbi:MAG: pilus assembly protein [Acidobacteria bacterium]|nr:pilus assembly protein [Acidobacteriota bacterium]